MTDIFVFGSNLAGYHGAGSAKAAVDLHGAKWGKGVGIQGNSYAIPTKDKRIQTLPIEQIYPFVQLFLEYARVTSENNYNVVEIGCGLAGYKPEQIAILFADAPENVFLTSRFKGVIKRFTDARQLELNKNFAQEAIGRKYVE